ncbi:MAG: ABC transporter permease, partial [Firmicutes bacterium]|nr:ABC transporter permease [Bacillota bacterium]
MNTASVWKIMWREIYRDKLALVGLILFVLITATVYIWAMFIDPVDAAFVNLRTRLLPPGGDFFLGTDSAGRDMLHQLILSARNSFTIAYIVTFGGAIIGITFGLLAGFYGGHVDNVLMRLFNFWGMVPSLMLIIVFLQLVPNYGVVTFSLMMIGIFTWMSFAG